MKKKLFSSLLGITMLSVFVAPFVLANSSSFVWDMTNRYVNGYDNGEIHAMTSGTMSISGSMYIYSSLPGATGPLPVTIKVYRDAFGPDPLAGSIIKTPIKGQTVSYSGNLGTEPTGDYYLEISKTEDDGHDTKGSGTLKTQ